MIKKTWSAISEGINSRCLHEVHLQRTARHCCRVWVGDQQKYVQLIWFLKRNPSCVHALTYWRELGKTDVCVSTWMQYYKDMTESRVCTIEVWHACQKWFEIRRTAIEKKHSLEALDACMVKRACHGIPLSVFRSMSFGLRRDSVWQAYAGRLRISSVQ